MSTLPTCESILLDRQGSCLYVTLNRPDARNALTAEMVEELSAVAEAIKRAPKMRSDQIIVVNLSGRGDKDLDTVIQALGI